MLIPIRGGKGGFSFMTSCNLSLLGRSESWKPSEKTDTSVALEDGFLVGLLLVPLDTSEVLVALFVSFCKA